MLLIKAKGGLGNRLLSAATAIAYADATGRDWCIDWSDGLYAPNGKNAIDFLFQNMSERAFSRSMLGRGAVVPSLWNGRVESSIREIISRDFSSQHSNPLIYRKLSAPLSRVPASNDTEVFWSYTSKYGRVKRFLPPGKQMLGRDVLLGQILKEYFRPNKIIAAAVENLLEGQAEPTLGVHIRYTDLKVPIEKLIANVQVHIKECQYHSIYLSTDSRDAEELFKKRFDNVITQTKRYSADNTQLHQVSTHVQSIEDAQSALVDMFALSACNGLVYCSRSTFAESSRLFGNFENRKLIDVDRYNILVQFKRFLQEHL